MSPTVFVTGAAGVIGRPLCADLKRDHRVVALVHTHMDIDPVLERVHGDLGEPGLGIDRTTWDSLAETVDIIVHSGALTRWGEPEDNYASINVGGTEAALDLASQAGVPLILMSTAFIEGLRRPEGWRVLSDDNVVLPYITSKLGAEELVRSSNVDHAIFRPTNLVGHSIDGSSSRPQIIQLLAEWLATGRAPFFPSHAGNLIDVIPLDICVSAVADAVRHRRIGGDYWLTHGAEAEPVEPMLDVIYRYAEQIGKRIEPIPVVDPGEGLPIPIEQLHRRARDAIKILVDVSEVIAAAGGTLPTSLPDLARTCDIQPFSGPEVLARTLAYNHATAISQGARHLAGARHASEPRAAANSRGRAANRLSQGVVHEP